MTSRYICDVFSEMRACDETKNYSYLRGLIEEAQTMANRMEAALTAQSDYRYWDEETKRAKEQVEKLRKEADRLQKQTKSKQKTQ